MGSAVIASMGLDTKHVERNAFMRCESPADLRLGDVPKLLHDYKVRSIADAKRPARRELELDMTPQFPGTGSSL